MLVKAINRKHTRYVVKRSWEHQRALEEAKALSALSSHPNIVDFYEVFWDCGHDDAGGAGSVNIVMGYCDGGDLSAHIRAKSRSGVWFPERQILDWFTQATQAVSFMHQRGWIHRDLKPSNIFLTSNGVIKVRREELEAGPSPIVPSSTLIHSIPPQLGDYGLAQYIEDQEEDEEKEIAPATSSACVSPVAGTPYYLSPEQCRCEPFR